MKKRVTFASQVRHHAALCSAAFLLSACGGTTDTMGNGPALAAETVAAPVQAGAASAPVNAVPAVDTAVAVEAAPTVAAFQPNLRLDGTCCLGAVREYESRQYNRRCYRQRQLRHARLPGHRHGA